MNSYIKNSNNIIKRIFLFFSFWFCILLHKILGSNFINKFINIFLNNIIYSKNLKTISPLNKILVLILLISVLLYLLFNIQFYIFLLQNFSIFYLLPLLLFIDLICISKNNIIKLIDHAILGFSLIFLYFTGYIIIYLQKFLSSIEVNSFFISTLNIFYLDTISIFLIILSIFLIPICALIARVNIRYRFKEYLIALCIIEFMLIIFFSTNNIFIFFLLFETILIPMYFVITL